MIHADSLGKAFLGKKKQPRELDSEMGLGENKGRKTMLLVFLNHALTQDSGHHVSFPLCPPRTDFSITCGVLGILGEVRMTSRSTHSHVLLTVKQTLACWSNVAFCSCFVKMSSVLGMEACHMFIYVTWNTNFSLCMCGTCQSTEPPWHHSWLFYESPVLWTSHIP